jgi:hypothetical protein
VHIQLSNDRTPVVEQMDRVEVNCVVVEVAAGRQVRQIMSLIGCSLLVWIADATTEVLGLVHV